MDNLDDASEVRQILRDARRGDRRGLSDLLQRHRDRLRCLIHVRLDRRLRGRVDASDVIQETLLQAASDLDGYLKHREGGRSSFFVWLRLLAIRKLRVIHRRHFGIQARDVEREISADRRRVADSASDPLIAKLPGALTSPSRALQRIEQTARLEESLGRLDPADREVLVLRHYEQLSNQETAEVLGISGTAACNRYVRSLKRLRHVLAEMPGGIGEVQP